MVGTFHARWMQLSFERKGRTQTFNWATGMVWAYNPGQAETSLRTRFAATFREAARSYSHLQLPHCRHQYEEQVYLGIRDEDRR
jgi:hypothetical protein